jgi:hypothetical protein
MTVGTWLATREPAPPAELSARLHEVLGPRLDESAERAPEVLLDAATALLGSLLDGAGGRESALDLLTADALATYAYEAAADSPDAGRALTERGMEQLSAAAATRR